MVLYNNPPQPVPTAIRNAVTYQDRVALLLNGAGSSKQNPIQSKNPGGLDTTGANGYSLRLSFGMADATETIVSAVASLASDDGSVYGTSTSFKNSITSSTSTYLFTADLHIGGDFPSISNPETTGGEAQLVTISIVTSLDRRISQQVWVAREPSDMVTLDGTVTTSSSPLRLSAENFDTAVTVPFSVQFYPTWNDEIGRQHGSSATALQSNIRKPYGGAVTVEIRKDSLTGTVVQAETAIENVTTITETVSAAGTQEYVFLFRSKAGSSTYLSKKAWVEFYACPTGTGGGTDDNPDIDPVGGTGDPDPPPVIDDIDPESPSATISFNITSLGAGTSASFHYRTLRAVHFDSSGNYVPMAGEVVGSGTYGNWIQTGTVTVPVSSIVTNTADFQVVVGYIKNNNGSRSKSLVFTRTIPTDHPTDHPKPPSITGTPTFSWDGTKGRYDLEFTLASVSGWDDEEVVSATVTPIDGAITSGGSEAQDTSDLIVQVGTAETRSTPSGTKTSGSYTLNFTDIVQETNAVHVKIYNASGGIGYSDIITISNGIPYEVKKGPTLSALNISAAYVISATISDDGGQVGSYTAMSFATSASDGDGGYRDLKGTITSLTLNGNTLEGTIPSGSQEPGAYYSVSVRGEQGWSNSLTATRSTIGNP